MTDSVASALFVYTKETAHLSPRMQEKSGITKIDLIEFNDLMQDPQAILNKTGHVVVSGDLSTIKVMLGLAAQLGFSVGIVPTAAQNDLIRYYDLPKDIDAAIDLALRSDGQDMDLILCNDNVLLFKGTIGRLPLLDAFADHSRLRTFTTAIKEFFRLKLRIFDYATDGDWKIKTAASGCMIIQHHASSLASRLIAHDSNPSDGMISMVVSAPRSVIEYIGFLARLLLPARQNKRLPDAIGYIKSPQIDIQAETKLDVMIDGERATRTPLHCEISSQPVRLNIGPKSQKTSKSNHSSREIFNVDHLPRGKELIKAKKQKRVPFFSYASEERFRELFKSLRADAKIDRIYIVLMALSTMLATVGLYSNSASVIIGAMLLAPLMAPIISLAMGILRNDERMLKNSSFKIFCGIIIALLASALIALLFPHKPVTYEMQARLNPTLLDLAVAILSGIAGAYSKSFKEIIQSLAGVAIAVALVPPLAVAGTGIGRLDFYFFFQAFLLFATNLIGIVLAASFTFTLLGYSSAVRNKRNIGIVLLICSIIAIPLYMSYNQIVQTAVYEENWQDERFLVNGKYIIIQKANFSQRGDKEIISMEILTRELLTRHDLNEFKRKIQTNFSEKLIIRAQTVYIP